MSQKVACLIGWAFNVSNNCKRVDKRRRHGTRDGHVGHVGHVTDIYFVCGERALPSEGFQESSI